MASLIQMNYALSLAREQSFQKAAKKCFVTQPTLSMQIQKLEEELEVTIFDRSRKPVVPTPVGTILLQRFRRVMEEYQGIFSVIAREKGEVSGDYNLGVIPTIAPFLLPDLIPILKKLYPRLNPAIKEQTTTDIVRNLKEGTLDAGILSTPLKDPGITEFRLYDEPLVLLCPKSYCPSVLSDGSIAIDSLTPEDLILLTEGHCLRHQALDLCRLREPELMPYRLETNSLMTLTGMIRRDQYYTVLPLLAANELAKQDRSFRIHAFENPTPCREVALVTHRSMIKSAVNNAVISCIKESRAVKSLSTSDDHLIINPT